MNAKSAKAASLKKPMSNKKYLAIWVPVLAFVTIIAVVANMALVIAGGWVGSQFGNGTYTFTNSAESASWNTEYFTSDYADMDAVDAAARALVEEIAAGGIVLAKNQDATLPLDSGEGRLRASAPTTRWII